MLRNDAIQPSARMVALQSTGAALGATLLCNATYCEDVGRGLEMIFKQVLVRV